MTIEEICQILRSDMNDRFAKKEQFSYLKELITPPSNNQEKAHRAHRAHRSFFVKKPY